MVGYGFNKDYQENGTLFQPTISALYHYLGVIYEMDPNYNTKILVQDYIHHDQGYFASLNYFKQFDANNYTYQDMIGDWLEQSYQVKFPEDGKIILYLFLDEDFLGKHDLFIFNITMH